MMRPYAWERPRAREWVTRFIPRDMSLRGHRLGGLWLTYHNKGRGF